MEKPDFSAWIKGLGAEVAKLEGVDFVEEKEEPKEEPKPTQPQEEEDEASDDPKKKAIADLLKLSVPPAERGAEPKAGGVEGSSQPKASAVMAAAAAVKASAPAGEEGSPTDHLWGTATPLEKLKAGLLGKPTVPWSSPAIRPPAKAITPAKGMQAASIANAAKGPLGVGRIKAADPSWDPSWEKSSWDASWEGGDSWYPTWKPGDAEDSGWGPGPWKKPADSAEGEDGDDDSKEKRFPLVTELAKTYNKRPGGLSTGAGIKSISRTATAAASTASQPYLSALSSLPAGSAAQQWYAQKVATAQLNSKVMQGQALSDEEMRFLEIQMLSEALEEQRKDQKIEDQQDEVADHLAAEGGGGHTNWSTVMTKAHVIKAKKAEAEAKKAEEEAEAPKIPEPKKGPVPAFRNAFVMRGPGMPKPNLALPPAVLAASSAVGAMASVAAAAASSAAAAEAAAAGDKVREDEPLGAAPSPSREKGLSPSRSRGRDASKSRSRGRSRSRSLSQRSADAAPMPIRIKTRADKERQASGSESPGAPPARGAAKNDAGGLRLRARSAEGGAGGGKRGHKAAAKDASEERPTKKSKRQTQAMYGDDGGRDDRGGRAGRGDNYGRGGGDRYDREDRYERDESDGGGARDRRGQKGKRRSAADDEPEYPPARDDRRGSRRAPPPRLQARPPTPSPSPTPSDYSESESSDGKKSAPTRTRKPGRNWDVPDGGEVVAAPKSLPALMSTDQLKLEQQKLQLQLRRQQEIAGGGAPAPAGGRPPRGRGGTSV